MKSKIVLASALLCLTSSAFALDGTYRFQPDASSVRGCAKLGFTGPFRFSISSRATTVGRVLFTNTNKGFVVFKAGDDQWRMSISGSWSEQIFLDFAEGSLTYDSGRPGRSGSCAGSIR